MRGWESEKEYQRLIAEYNSEKERHETLTEKRAKDLEEYQKNIRDRATANGVETHPKWYLESFAKVRAAKEALDSYARSWCTNRGIDPIPLIGKKVSYNL